MARSKDVHKKTQLPILHKTDDSRTQTLLKNGVLTWVSPLGYATD